MSASHPECPVVRTNSGRDFHDSLQVDANPGLFANVADADFYLAQRGLQRNRSVTPGDGNGAASDESAALDKDLLARPRPAVAAADDDEERTFEENVFFEGGPVFHWGILAVRQTIVPGGDDRVN